MELTNKYAKAFELVNDWHSDHMRKCSSTPYISHLMSVSALVLEHGGDEDTAIAALLHDSLEDCSDYYGASNLRELIVFHFGERVLSIVEEVTETDEDPKPPWRARKEKYIAHLYKASPQALLVAAADKIHNARTTLNGLKINGHEATWSMFNADPESQYWWYNQLVIAFFMTDTPKVLVDELESIVDELFVDFPISSKQDVTGLRYPEVVARAQEYNSKLRASHSGFSNGSTVYLNHHDGFMVQRSAFYEIWGEYLVIFGEHMPPQVHPLDEVSNFGQFRMEYPSTYIKEELDD